MKKKNLLFILLGLVMIILPSNVKAMEVNIQTVEDGTLTLELDPGDTIMEIKEMLNSSIYIPTGKQLLFFNNNELENDLTLADYSIQKQSTIIMKYAELSLNGENLTKEKSVNKANTATYDFDNKILTLNNYNGGSINYYGEDKLTIILNNNNVINIKNDREYGIYSDNGDVKITGNGNLTINDAYFGINSYGKLELDGTTITVKNAEVDGISSSKEITINANVNIEAFQFGIIASNKLTINGGNVNVVTSLGGIIVEGGLEINGGNVDVTAGEAGAGAAIVVVKMSENNKITIKDNMEVMQNDISIQPVAITFLSNNFTGFTFGKENPSIVLGLDVETPNVAYKVTIKAKHNVTFNTNGGTEIPNQILKDKEKVTEPEKPTKTGFIFKGWYEDDKYTKYFDFTKEITEDITLYARWDSEYTYTFLNGDNQELTSGKIDKYEIRVDGDYTLFTSLKIGDLELEKDTDYKVTEGSTIITFLKSGLEKLNKLRPGTYSVIVNYTNSSKAAGKLVIKKDEKNPGTLDNITSSMIISGISLIGLVGSALYINKKVW